METDGDKLNEPILSKGVDHEPFSIWDTSGNIQIKLTLKQEAYRQKFGEEYYQEDEYILPEKLCEQELKRAERILSEEGHDAFGKIESVPTMLFGYSEIESVFEIDVAGHRYAIQRDVVVIAEDTFVNLSVSNEVLTLKDISKWPDWLTDGISEIQADDSASTVSTPFELTPKIASALSDIATGGMTEEYKYLAEYLHLGDIVPIHKTDLLGKKVVGEALDRFGVSSVDELKKILKTIGLGVILTSNRLLSSNGQDESGYNSKTEVDALLEAIHKTI